MDGVGNTAAYQKPSHLCTICVTASMTHCLNIYVDFYSVVYSLFKSAVYKN
jgi:hypothetical protein